MKNSNLCFAKQWLDFYKKKIYVNGKQILKYKKETDYNMDKLDTKLFGYDLLEDLPDEKEVDYDFLKKRGLVIISLPIRNKRRKQYYLYDRTLPYPKEATELMRIPPGHRIIFNPFENSFKLWGRFAGDNFEGEWVSVKKEKEKSKPKKESTIFNIDPRKFLKKRLGGMFKTGEEEREFRKIEGIPVMITEENLLVCIPITKDLARIGIVGKVGYGKTSCFLSILGHIKWKYPEHRVGIINDSLGQFHTNAQPTSYLKFKGVLDKLNETPKPLPIVNLYVSSPNLNGCELFKKHKKEGIGFRYVFSFLHFLRAYEYFSYGIGKMKLNNATRYLNSLIPYFLKCTTGEEIKNVMYEHIPKANKDKGLGAMIFKWKETFDSIFKEMFLDVNFKEETTASEWTLEYDNTKLTDNPFNICMEAGLMPNLVTKYAKSYLWFRNFTASILMSIIKKKHKHPVWIGADEIGDLYEIGKKKDNMQDALMTLFRQGRFNHVGFVYDIQIYEKLHLDIRKMTSHLFTTLIEDDHERKLIAKNYGLTKNERDSIGKLRKFEFMAISNEGWIVYDRNGCRIKEEENRTCFKGQIIPPISEQSKPGGE